MGLSNKLMYALLGLSALMLVGMFTASWRLVLYPILFMIGISVLFGFTRELSRGRRGLAVAGAIVVLFGAFFVTLDIMTGGEPTASTSYILGMTPPTALYLLVWPVLVVAAGILYAVTFTQEDVEPETLRAERAAVNEASDEEGSR